MKTLTRLFIISATVFTVVGCAKPSKITVKLTSEAKEKAVAAAEEYIAKKYPKFICDSFRVIGVDQKFFWRNSLIGIHDDCTNKSEFEEVAADADDHIIDMYQVMAMGYTMRYSVARQDSVKGRWTHFVFVDSAFRSMELTCDKGIVYEK